MRNLIIAVFTMLCLIVGSTASAEFVDCGLMELERVYVQADRDDNHSHSNSLVLKFTESSCNETNHAYIEADHELFPAMVATALAAKASNRPLRVYVNTSKVNGSATQISILSFE